MAENETLELLPAEQLFLCEAWAESPRLVDRVKEYIHTGRHAIRDEQRSREIIEAILNGASKSLVANTFHVGRQTVTAIYRLFEESGQLLQIKLELRNRWIDVWRLSMWRTQEHLHRGTMPAQVLPMLNGVATDKIIDLSHSVPEETHQKTIDIKARSVLEALVRARAGGPAPGASAVESNAAERRQLLANGQGEADTAFDTATPTAGLDLAPLAAVPRLGGAEAGGGIEPRRPVASADGLGDENFGTKEGDPS